MTEIKLWVKTTLYLRGVYNTHLGIYDGRGYHLDPLPYEKEGYEESSIHKLSLWMLEKGLTSLSSDKCPHDNWAAHAWVLPSGRTLFPLADTASYLGRVCEPALQAGSGLRPEQREARMVVSRQAAATLLSLREEWLKAHRVTSVTKAASLRHLREGVPLYYV